MEWDGGNSGTCVELCSFFTPDILCEGCHGDELLAAAAVPCFNAKDAE